MELSDDRGDKKILPNLKTSSVHINKAVAKIDVVSVSSKPQSAKELEETQAELVRKSPDWETGDAYRSQGTGPRGLLSLKPKIPLMKLEDKMNLDAGDSKPKIAYEEIPQLSPDSKLQPIKGLEAGDADPQPKPDKYKSVVYFIMLLHGMGTLMYWNIFINAKNYYEDYKLGRNYLKNPEEFWYSAQFLPAFSWCSQIPSVLFSWINVFTPCGGTTWKRIIISLAVEGVVCLVTIILACIDTSSYGGVFFGITMFSVVLMSIAAGFYQNCIYGIGARLDLVGAVIIGQNLCGVFFSVTLIIVLLSGAAPKTTALFYFGTAFAIILACVVSFISLPKFAYYASRTSDPVGTALESPNVKPNYMAVLKKCWPQCYNIFILFLITLLGFPKILADVKSLDNGSYLGDRYFTPVGCFLVFNLFTFFGNLLASIIEWPSPNRLWILTTGRIIFIPFFLCCNYQPHGFTRDQSTVFIPDSIFLLLTALFGLSSGYLSTLAMTYCPRTVEGPAAKLAGMLSAAFLVSGVLVGVSLSYCVPYLIAS